MTRKQLIKLIGELYTDGLTILQEEERRNDARLSTPAEQNNKSKPSTKNRANAGSKKANSDQPSVGEVPSEPEKKAHAWLVGILIQDYQTWYSQALSVIRTLLPERLAEFEDQYRVTKRKEIDYLNYTISDYLLGLTVTRSGQEVVRPRVAFRAKFLHQLTILNSAMERAGSLLSNIEGVLQYELFESEIAAAADLLRKGFRRAAGALVGVTLEAHLAKVAETHAVKIPKKNATIADLNDPLRSANVVDLPMWRLIQRLADIRNLCAHSKDREPTADEVADLIAGVKKVIAEVN